MMCRWYLDACVCCVRCACILMAVRPLERKYQIKKELFSFIKDWRCNVVDECRVDNEPGNYSASYR